MFPVALEILHHLEDWFMHREAVAATQPPPPLRPQPEVQMVPQEAEAVFLRQTQPHPVVYPFRHSAMRGEQEVGVVSVVIFNALGVVAEHRLSVRTAQ
jgi:hypothetical protein